MTETLSDKEFDDSSRGKGFYTKDVKEFIRKLVVWYKDLDDVRTFEEFLKEEAGEKLTK